MGVASGLAAVCTSNLTRCQCRQRFSDFHITTADLALIEQARLGCRMSQSAHRLWQVGNLCGHGAVEVSEHVDCDTLASNYFECWLEHVLCEHTIVHMTTTHSREQQRLSIFGYKRIGVVLQIRADVRRDNVAAPLAALWACLRCIRLFITSHIHSPCHMVEFCIRRQNILAAQLVYFTPTQSRPCGKQHKAFQSFRSDRFGQFGNFSWGQNYRLPFALRTHCTRDLARVAF